MEGINSDPLKFLEFQRNCCVFRKVSTSLFLSLPVRLNAKLLVRS